MTCVHVLSDGDFQETVVRHETVRALSREQVETDFDVFTLFEMRRVEGRLAEVFLGLLSIQRISEEFTQKFWLAFEQTAEACDQRYRRCGGLLRVCVRIRKRLVWRGSRCPPVRISVANRQFCDELTKR